VAAVSEATQRAARAVRDGVGPYFLEYRTYRFRAHSMFDPELYRTKAEVEEWKRRDPIRAFCARLESAGWLAAEDLERVESDVAAEIADAVQFAESGTLEPVEDLERHTYAEAGA
jgi:TPP-dependent pyruvate/acetoin dehydrogenase alpha subunit